MFRFLNLVLVLIITLLQIRLWTGEGSLPENWQLESQIKQQKEVTEELAARNALLAAEVKDLRSGLDTIEERARYELGMVRKNETFFLLIDPNKPNPTSGGATSIHSGSLPGNTQTVQ